MNAPIRPRLALAASVAGASLVALDGTVLLVAQPRLQQGLAASVAQVQWASTAYLIAVGALLVVSGRLGDRYGHQRTFLAGLCGFAAASAGIAAAPGIGWVIGLRAVQGVFAALLQPATLALLRTAYPADRLTRPVAIRTSAIGIASAVGPALGGALVAHLGWRSVFLLNVPFALVAVALTLATRIPPVVRRRPQEQLDLAGAWLLAVALAALVAVVVEAPAHGWTAAPILLGFAVAACATAGLVAHERRATHPIVPGTVARSRPVTASTAMLLATTAGVFGTLFAAAFYLQHGLGLDAFTSALRVLPLTAFMIVGAPVAGMALRRVGARRTALGGVLLVALGIAALGALGRAGWAGPAGFTAMGAGFATVMVTATGTVVGDAPPRYAGVVGGLKQTANNVGSALGIAIATGVMPSVASTAAAHPTATVAPMGSAMLLMAALAATALLPAALLPSRRSTASGRRAAGATGTTPPAPGDRVTAEDG